MNRLTGPKELPEFERAIRKLQKRADGKGWPYNSGLMGISINAGLVGLVSNSYFRRMLMVRKWLVFTSLPMAVIPAVSILPAWLMFISKPLVEGDMRCDICAQMRGVALNLSFGLIYPSIISIPLVASIAIRYNTMEIPKIEFNKKVFRTQIQFWLHRSRYFKTQFISLALFQCVAGMYIAHNQYQVAEELIHKQRWTLNVKDH